MLCGIIENIELFLNYVLTYFSQIINQMSFDSIKALMNSNQKKEENITNYTFLKVIFIFINKKFL